MERMLQTKPLNQEVLVVISRLLKVLESKGNVILHRGKIELL